MKATINIKVEQKLAQSLAMTQLAGDTRRRPAGNRR
jgi:hypothetical protein